MSTGKRVHHKTEFGGPSLTTAAETAKRKTTCTLYDLVFQISDATCWHFLKHKCSYFQLM